MTINKTVAAVAGWYGMSAVIVAYGLVSLRVVSSADWTYQLLNLSGALGMLIVALQKKVRQSVVLNAFWIAIAVTALMSLID